MSEYVGKPEETAYDRCHKCEWLFDHCVSCGRQCCVSCSRGVEVLWVSGSRAKVFCSKDCFRIYDAAKRLSPRELR